MPHLHLRRRHTGLGAVTLAFVLLLGACGGGGSSAATTTTSQDVPLSLVVLSLPILLDNGQQADGAAQKGDFDTAVDRYAFLHDAWKALRATVKKTDRGAYDKIEAAESLILDGAQHHDAARVAKGVADQAAVVTAFIKAHK